jgi:cytochrome P450
MGWGWKDGFAMQARYGDAFTIVTPVENEVFVADAKAADDILTRRKDFVKKAAIYAMFDIFGRSVTSVEGETWQRHRKITTPPFNERNSSLVWTESVRQAREMLQGWLSKGYDRTTGTVEDTSLLALHVLTGAGFGISYPFDSELKTPAAGHSMSYRDALQTVISHVFVTVMIGSAKVPSWLLPKSVAVVGVAMTEFKQYMVEMVTKEKAAHARGDAAGANLMSSLVHASEEAERAGGKGVQSKGGLTDDEIYGNLFIYNIAGHETTANILAYAVAFLACYPQWQEWLGEEIDRVLVPEADTTEAEQYYRAFPQLKRCLALMVSPKFSCPLTLLLRLTGSASTKHFVFMLH